MSLRFRMARGGAKKRPYYRIVVADSRSPRDGRFIERIGTFNPMLPKDHAERLKFDEERVKHWLKMGATPSDRLARMFSAKGLVPKPVVREQTIQHIPKKQQKAAAAEAAAAAKAS